MTSNKAKDLDIEKLVEDITLVSLDLPLPSRQLTKKRVYRIRRIAEPHIRPHISKGRPYYYFCRGIDKEIYLGDAETIYKAVKGLQTKGRTR